MSFEKQCQVTDRGLSERFKTIIVHVLELERRERILNNYDNKDSFSSKFAFVRSFVTIQVIIKILTAHLERIPGVINFMNRACFAPCGIRN